MRHSPQGTDGVPGTQLSQVIRGTADVYSQPFSVGEHSGAATEIIWSRPSYQDAFSLIPDTDPLSFTASTDAAQVNVRLATAAALPACTAAGAGVGKTLTEVGNGALTVDGVAVAAADLVLVKNQVAPLDNGVYTVTAPGTAGAPFVLTRTPGFDAFIQYNTVFLATAGSTNTNAKFYAAATALLSASFDIELAVSYNPRLHQNDVTARFAKILDVTAVANNDESFVIVNQTGIYSKWLRTRITPTAGIGKIRVRSYGKG
jgi:hypothetical protein